MFQTPLSKMINIGLENRTLNTKKLEKRADYFNVKTRNSKLILFYVVDPSLQELLFSERSTCILYACVTKLS